MTAESIKTVLLIVAMRAEAEPIIQSLGLEANDDTIFSTPTMTKTYSGKVGVINVHLAHNGQDNRFDVDKVGTNAATLTTYLAISAFKPDLVVSAGTAGGFKAQGAEIASIFASTATQNHDRRIPLPGFDKAGVGRTEAHPANAMATELGFKTGVVSTGNSLDCAAEDMKIMQDGNTAVKDMESAAVAYVCSLWSTPMIALKAVTDIVDGDKAPEVEFLQNLHKASSALQDAIARMLQYMDGKALNML